MTLGKFLEKAAAKFGLGRDGRGRSNEFYVEVAARLSRDGLSLARDHPVDREGQVLPSEVLLSPTSYLTGIQVGTDWWFEQPTRSGPSISIVIGEYGLGKTELLHGVAEAIREASEESGIHVLPVSLSRVRSLRASNTPLGPQDFLRALLEHIGAPLTDSLIEEVSARLGDGSLVLLLDALDELVSDESEHNAFIESLGRLAEFSVRGVDMHIILSMRLEHLSKVHLGDMSHAGRPLETAAGRLVAVDFLLLDFFSDALVRDYVGYRLDDPEAIRLLPETREFLDLLRRPLLVRILCDLVVEESKKPQGREKLFTQLRDVTSAAALLRLSTIRARDDQVLESAQAQIREHLGPRGSVRWSHRELSRVALEAYLGGESGLDRPQILEILVCEDDDESEVEAARHLSGDDLWMAICKCPFLKRLGESAGASEADLRVGFTHKVFYEYFATEGVVLELQRRRGENNLAFHNLVLNVDMHRFLRDLTILTEVPASSPLALEDATGGEAKDRGEAKDWPRLVGEELWYTETGRAYGLEPDCEPEWAAIGGLSKDRKDDLDAIRRPLLDARSGLKDGAPPDEVRAEIRRFLDEDEHGDDPLAPRYLIPNYEAVAVSLLKSWIGTERLHGRFLNLLDGRLEQTLGRLRADGLGHSEREILELLIERLLDVGLRCNYPWAKKPYRVVPARNFGVGDGEISIVIEIGEKTRRRVKNLLEVARRGPLF